jgi:hypothetical protein
MIRVTQATRISLLVKGTDSREIFQGLKNVPVTQTHPKKLIKSLEGITLNYTATMKIS